MEITQRRHKGYTMRALLTAAVILSGCASPQGVRQQDLVAWSGVSVEALDTHSFFLTLPVVKTVTDNGVEIRNYVNKIGISRCLSPGFANTQSVSGSQYTTTFGQFTSFQGCTSQLVGCDNVFYIQDRRIVEYRPVGRCYTEERLQPEPGWQRFQRAPNSS
jgi:hypothetical protein